MTRQTLEDRLFIFARRFMPQLEALQGRERTSGVADVIVTLYAIPFTLGGLIWLVAVTDFALWTTDWPILLFMFALLFLFQKFNFFLFIEVTPGTYADWSWSLWGVITWSAALIFGPTALWLTVIWRLVTTAGDLRRADEPNWRWNLIRNLLLSLMTLTLAALIALEAYEVWGGPYPLPGLRPSDPLLPAFGATAVWLALSGLVWAPLLGYYSLSREYAWTRSAWMTFTRFIGITLGWRFFVDPFAILAAGLYAQHGFGIYVFFIIGLLLASMLAHQLSQSLDRNHLRSRELEKLERLGRALLELSPDAALLPEVLRQHVSNMFPFCHLEIRIFPGKTVVHYPADWPLVEEHVWA